jgi:hypothetical protein
MPVCALAGRSLEYFDASGENLPALLITAGSL